MTGGPPPRQRRPFTATQSLELVAEMTERRAVRALRALDAACPAVMQLPELRLLCVTVLTDRLIHVSFAHPRAVMAGLAGRMERLSAPAFTRGVTAAAQAVLDSPKPHREATRDRLIELLIDGVRR